MNNSNHPGLNKWIHAVHGKDPDEVVACYTKDAVLLPTVSNRLCFTPEQRRAYFIKFLSKEPRCHVMSLDVKSLTKEIDVLSGTYRFQFIDLSEAIARFSYVFQKDFILQHHSSLMPEN